MNSFLSEYRLDVTCYLLHEKSDTFSAQTLTSQFDNTQISKIVWHLANPLYKIHRWQIPFL